MNRHFVVRIAAALWTVAFLLGFLAMLWYFLHGSFCYVIGNCPTKRDLYGGLAAVVYMVFLLAFPLLISGWFQGKEGVDG